VAAAGIIRKALDVLWKHCALKNVIPIYYQSRFSCRPSPKYNKTMVTLPRENQGAVNVLIHLSSIGDLLENLDWAWVDVGGNFWSGDRATARPGRRDVARQQHA
jgi:hypothetical protein